MDYLDWSHRLLLSSSYSAGHSAFSQESVKQYFKINITAVIPRFKKMPKHNDLFHIPSGRFFSLVHLFLLLVLKETTALKELLLSHRCAAGGRKWG